MLTRLQKRNATILQPMEESHTEYVYDVELNMKNSCLKPTFDVNIDFDHASKLWKKNKIRIGEGMYKYKRIKRKPIRNKVIC
jgi:hypothetical protein